MNHVWEVCFCDFDGERLDLRSPHGGNAGEQAAQGEAAGAVKEAAEGQFVMEH